jgi:hypothetical protein
VLSLDSPFRHLEDLPNAERPRADIDRTVQHRVKAELVLTNSYSRSIAWSLPK